MLQHLTISNYAIIQHLTIQFGKELNIITGETGAGKSILLGAMGLLLGNRTDTSVLRNKQQKCVVEAEFALANDTDVNVLLEQWELDTLPNSVTLRREITANSKSRVFINDTPVTLAQLKTVAALLVDLHQQFDTLDLGNSSFQRNIVDAIAQNTATRASYTQVHKLWRQQQQQLAEQLEQRNQLQKEQDYYTFLFQELADAAIVPQEVELLEDEQKTLANAETITRQLACLLYTSDAADDM
jgi:DNA repair protein RecN (Recombination protein N)